MTLEMTAVSQSRASIAPMASQLLNKEARVIEKYAVVVAAVRSGSATDGGLRPDRIE
jgi:hypothetical protein